MARCHAKELTDGYEPFNTIAGTQRQMSLEPTRDQSELPKNYHGDG